MIGSEVKGDLHQQLTTLRSDADENLQRFRSVRRDLWRLLAKTYMWWREASQQPGLLEEEFEQAHIKFNRRNDVDVNFNPVIKLVWHIRHPTRSDKTAISNWTSVLEILHRRFSENPENFRHEPVGKLMALIDKEGGVSGLIKADSKDPPEKESNEKGSSVEEGEEQEGQSKKVAKVEIDQPTEVALAAHTRNVFKAEEKGMGTVEATFPIRKADDGFTVLLAKVGADGKTIILDSTNDPAAIEAVLRKVGRMDSKFVNPLLLGLGDAIRVQMLPFSARPPEKKRSRWFLKKYADETEYSSSDLSSSRREEKKRRLTSSRRVHILNHGKRVVVSGGMLRASTVVIHDLHTPLFNVKDDVFLRTVDRPFVEELFAKNVAHLWNVEIVLRPEGSDQKSILKVMLKDKISGNWEFLHFYRLDRSNIAHQIPMPLPVATKPLWKATVGIEWLRQAKFNWARPWFEELGRRNNMFDVENRRIKITVRKDKMIIGFANGEMPIPFEADAELTSKVPTVEFFSKDLAPILHNMIDAEPQSSVELSGDRHGMFVRFSTHSGKTEIVIPTIDVEDEKRRDSEHFYVDGA
jgi:hypothetical protein